MSQRPVRPGSLDSLRVLMQVCYYTDTPDASDSPAFPSEERMLRIDPSDPRPIWRQIEDAVRHMVAHGALPPGQAVPSVRDLARDLQVNPATVSKAYQRLTDDRVLVVHRGEGTFVADRPPALPAEERDRLLDEAAVRYASRAATLGAARAEALGAAESAWDEMTKTRQGGQP